MNVPNPHNPPETEALEHHERVIVKELPKALASDLIRQWNDAVERFDQATCGRYDTLSAQAIIHLAWIEPAVSYELCHKLENLAALLGFTVDSKA